MLGWLLRNPIYRREARCLGLRGRILGWAFVGLLYAAFAEAAMPYLTLPPPPFSTPNAQFGPLWRFLHALTLLCDLVARFVAVLLTADCVSGEREADRGTLLLLSGMPPRRILAAMLLGRLRALLPFLLAILALFLGAPLLLQADLVRWRVVSQTWVGWELLALALQEMAIPLSALILSASVGVLCSTLFRSRAASISCAIVLMILPLLPFSLSVITGRWGGMSLVNVYQHPPPRWAGLAPAALCLWIAGRRTERALGLEKSGSES